MDRPSARGEAHDVAQHGGAKVAQKDSGFVFQAYASVQQTCTTIGTDYAPTIFHLFISARRVSGQEAVYVEGCAQLTVESRREKAWRRGCGPLDDETRHAQRVETAR